VDSDEGALRLAEAIEAIDARNALDPNLIEHEGTTAPRELVLARRATHWLDQLVDDPSPEQRVAVRAHHLERWLFPRADYPEGRAGYLRWRRDQQQRHAAAVREVLLALGWPAAHIDEVERLVRKRGSDAQAQAHEDALCLAFLEVQLEEVAGRLAPETALGVLRKTAAKMSERARLLAADALGPGAASDLAREVLGST
jgi:hypothetical protein